jgi:hypothetical protein
MPIGPFGPWSDVPLRPSFGRVVNIDFLAWFSEDEREQCPACGQEALVGAAEAPLFRVCLSCAAVWVGGKRIDAKRRLPVPAVR